MNWEQEIKDIEDANTYRKKYQDLCIAFEIRGDFIEWLFEHSEHCDHITMNEAWKEFDEWQKEK